MGRLAEAMPKTISAADRLRRSGCPPDTRRQVGDLLQALAVVECHFSVGGAAAVPAGLLRDLAVITAGLAGPSRLETGAGGMAVFTGLPATWQPPPLPELDQVLAGALTAGSGRRRARPPDARVFLAMQTVPVRARPEPVLLRPGSGWRE